MFAKAFRIMVTEPTQKGREKYGKLFWNYQDLVAFHVCSVVDPRCDQGREYSSSMCIAAFVNKSFTHSH